MVKPERNVKNKCCFRMEEVVGEGCCRIGGAVGSPAARLAMLITEKHCKDIIHGHL